MRCPGCGYAHRDAHDAPGFREEYVPMWRVLARDPGLIAEAVAIVALAALLLPR